MYKRFPNLGIWQRDRKLLGNLILYASGVWLQNLCRTGEIDSWRAQTKPCVKPGPRRKEQWPHTCLCHHTNMLICKSINMHECVYTYTKVKVLVTQSCLTLCDLLDCSPPGSSVCGILQAGVLEWVAMPLSRGCSQPTNQTWFSHVAGRFFTIWATRKVFFAYVQTYSQFSSW